ncbi:MAG: 16S rRNA (guanine(527)-N(7))-methyltransferase RsmG [Actinomycetia bacterium]|nr:16S rRNA (guanine(527)-N(7))-methyltransferase RsmG [Actinomycetes bacterium]
MIEFLKTYGIVVSAEQAGVLEEHLRFVLEKNRSINLTRITEHESALVLHVLDSLLVLPEVLSAPVGKLLDMGSGAGYPGLPLAVMSQRQTTLLDAREKKVLVLQEFLSQRAGLSCCRAVAGRAEEFAGEHREEYAVVTARALTALPSLLELASPLLQAGGWLIALKGALQADEKARADQLRAATGLSLRSQRAYSLPSGEHREVVVYEKMNSAQIELPRRVGRAQRKPLA